MTTTPTRDQLASEVHRLGGRMTEAVSQLHGLVVNNCLATETIVIPAAGVVSRQWRVPFGSVAVANHGAGTLTMNPGPAQGQAPTSGPGVVKVAGYTGVTVNVAGRDLTIYGTPGALVVLSVFANPQPPAFGIITPATTAVAVAAGQLVTGPGRIAGLALSETTGTAGARINVHDGTSAAGMILAPITLAANESIRDTFSDQGFTFTTGLFVEVVTGSVNGALFVSTGSVA